MEFIQTLWHDVWFGSIDRDDWRRVLRPLTTLIKNDGELAPRKDQVHVIDAKSVYDAVFKQAAPGIQDRRSAIELAIVAEALQRAGGHVRWVPHSRMIADLMTHEDISRASPALLEVLKKWQDGRARGVRRAAAA